MLEESYPVPLPRKLRHALERGRENPFEASRATEQVVAKELQRHISKPDILEEISAASLKEMKDLFPDIQKTRDILRKYELTYLYHLRRHEMADYHLQKIKKIAPNVSGKKLPPVKSGITTDGLKELTKSLPQDQQDLLGKLFK
jgi:hypothetical protein